MTPMLPRLHRVAGALAAGPLAGIAVGAAWGARAPRGLRVDYAWRLAAMLSVPGLLVGVALLVVALPLTARRIDAISAWISLRRKPIAALAALLPPACAVWMGLAARAGRHFLTAYHHIGLAALAQSAALLALALAFAAAVWVAAARLAPRVPEHPRAIPGALVAGVALAAAIIGHGVYWGDAQGHGGAAALLMGGYGVLKKPELDLAPVGMLAGIGLGAGALAYALRALGLFALPFALMATLSLLRVAAGSFADSPVAAEIEARPGLPRMVLRALRKRSDADRDGYSARYGGGDCNDRNAAVNPGAADVPGNNVDEDCSGRDAPRRSAPAAQASAPQGRSLTDRTPAGMNLVLITVDTLRWDTHYAGNPHPITPNLDRLAARGVVWNRAYAISSYTGRAIGPMMTGRYPTECARDGGHFTRYPASNVFFAERLKAAGFRTFGAASHFYFNRAYGLAQGMDVWDMSAEPTGGAQETRAADDRVADRVIAMLREPANTSGRFFLWAHFFDPHKQYVDHPELPLFGRGERAKYDREVMFTDRQIGRVLDALDALPGDVSARTVVVVTADHGEAFGEHGMSWHGVELWEELVRVPLVMRVPGLGARQIELPRSQIDLAPTLCELLRIPAPARDAADAFSGVSLAGDLYGEPAPARPVYIELPEGPFNSLRRSVIDDGWKLTERGVGRFELYDLRNDPNERVNLFASDSAQLARMRAAMEAVRGDLRIVPASR